MMAASTNSRAALSTAGAGQPFDQQAFNRYIVENGVVGFFEQPIKLASGRMSHWYVNWRKATGDVFLLDRLTDFILGFVTTLQESGSLGASPDCFFGVPEGATKIGVLTQFKWAKAAATYGPGSHACPIGRTAPKPHGSPQDRFFVGAPRGNTVIIEDTTTTGSSLLKTLDQLIETDITVVAALGLTSRQEVRDDRTTVSQAVSQRSSAGRPVHYFPMSKASDLLPLAIEKLGPSPAILREIEKEFAEFGEMPLTF